MTRIFAIAAVLAVTACLGLTQPARAQNNDAEKTWFDRLLELVMKTPENVEKIKEAEKKQQDYLDKLDQIEKNRAKPPGPRSGQ